MHGIAKISTKIRPHAYIISYKKTKKNTEKWLKYLLNAYSLEFFFFSNEILYFKYFVFVLKIPL